MEDKSKKTLFYQRDFLNKEHHQSLAAVYGEIKVGWHSKLKEEKGHPPDYDNIVFNISDCIRRIDLEFDTSDDEEEWKNSFEKIRKLEFFVTEFRKGLEELYELRKPLIEKNSDQNDKIQKISNEFSEFFANNKIDGKTILNFDFGKGRGDENHFELSILENLDDKIINDPTLTEFSRKMKSKYGVYIQITIEND